MTTNRSEGEMIAGRVRDGVCVLGCTLRGVHFASCVNFDGASVEPGACAGCAPSASHPGSVVCGRCFGRMAVMLREAPDMVGRLRSLSDPGKALLIEQVKVATRRGGSSDEAMHDRVVAADAILVNLRDWAQAHARRTDRPLPFHARFAGMTAETAFHLAREYARVIRTHLEQIASSPLPALQLADVLIVRHTCGTVWSVQDAIDRWGVERRDRSVAPEPEAEVAAGSVVVVEHTAEWGDPLITKREAELVAGSARTLRRWVKGGHVAPAGQITIAGARTVLYRRNDLVAVRAVMEDAVQQSQFPPRQDP